MEDYTRSRSYHDSRNDMQIEVYGNNNGNNRIFSYDLKSYSTSSCYDQNSNFCVQPKLKKGKSYTSSSPSFSGWVFNDPELQRKKRVAGYKVYAVEGKVKGSFRKSFRWIKDRYTQAVYGWW